MIIDPRHSSLPSTWLRAALLGSLWASNEIVLGSFLHNLNVPFAGSILASIGVIILTAGFRVWGDPRILWRAGIICALMKSVSPSAVILGPMIGIVIEALLFWGSVAAFRGHLLGLVLGSVLATVAPTLQKIAGLLVTYGWDAARLYVALFDLAVRSLGITDLGPDVAIIIFIALNAIPGIIALALGIIVARESEFTGSVPDALDTAQHVEHWSHPSGDQPFSLLLLGTHCAILAAVLSLISRFPLPWTIVVVATYAGFTLYRYPRIRQKVFRLRLGMELIIVALLAGLFLGQFSGTQTGWSWIGLITGVQMAVRAIFVVIAFSALSVELRNPRVINWFVKRGLGVVSSSLEVAFQALPTLIAVFGEQRQFFLHPVQSMRRMLGVVISMLPQLEGGGPIAPTVILVTGDQGSGKTTFLGSVVEHLRASQTPVAGLLAPVVFLNGQRIGYDVINIQTGASAPLCRIGTSDPVAQVGQFGILEKGMRLGSEALTVTDSKRSYLLIIDEIGPLELRGQGWAKSLEHLLGVTRGVLCISVRPSLVTDVVARWDLEPAAVWKVKEKRPQDCAEYIRHLLTANRQPLTVGG